MKHCYLSQLEHGLLNPESSMLTIRPLQVPFERRGTSNFPNFNHMGEHWRRSYHYIVKLWAENPVLYKIKLVICLLYHPRGETSKYGRKEITSNAMERNSFLIFCSSLIKHVLNIFCHLLLNILTSKISYWHVVLVVTPKIKLGWLCRDGN